MSSPTATFENRVRFAETDLQGVVFYGEFFTYLDEAVNEFLRTVGYSYDRMHENGWTTHIVHAELDFLAPATFGEDLVHDIQVSSLGETSFTAAYRGRRKADEALLAEGNVVHVAVDRDTGAARRLPDEFRAAVGA